LVFHYYDERSGRFRTFVEKFTKTVHLRARFSNALFKAMAQSYPTIIPGLRSPFDQVNRLV